MDSVKINAAVLSSMNPSKNSSTAENKITFLLIQLPAYKSLMHLDFFLNSNSQIVMIVSKILLLLHLKAIKMLVKQRLKMMKLNQL